MAMDRGTGKLITGVADVEQSIDTILDTIPGDRIMRADYGSGLFDLVDRVGMDASGMAKLASAGGEALRRFEKRVKVTRIAFDGTPGEVTQTVYGVVQATNERIVVRR